MKKRFVLAVAASVALGGLVTAQQSKPLTAEASTPEILDWMQGFPPPADKVIRFTDPDYFAFPKLRWTVCHFREMMPTVGVSNGSAGESKLPYAFDPGIDAVEFTPLGGDAPMTWREAFDVNYTDGILVLYRGRIVYERYAGCLVDATLHGAMWHRAATDGHRNGERKGKHQQAGRRGGIGSSN